ncbi:hypothetical protein GTO91_12670 [Heliobacterium undosum]|uniref:Uncharacterized protein n=1 Tax=Heliomicrobium undosum TaxID=121734 RepID=A0A845L200_9FIRM|nr:hypothetical protein [Heliomicrobium undosum]MZP30567.1 hypothetical protein [Heliomicrobium undosum]
MTAFWDLEQLERDLIGVTVEKAGQILGERGIDADFQPTGPEPALGDSDTSDVPGAPDAPGAPVQRVIQVRPGPSRLLIIYGRFRRYPFHGVD